MKKKDINGLAVKLAEYIMAHHADDVCSEMNCIMHGYVTDILSRAVAENGYALTEEDVYDLADEYFENIDFGFPEDWDESIPPELQNLRPHDYISERTINRKTPVKPDDEETYMYRFMSEELWKIIGSSADREDSDREEISKSVLKNVQKKLKALGFDVNTDIFEDNENDKEEGNIIDF